jgi:hypothetical protein
MEYVIKYIKCKQYICVFLFEVINLRFYTTVQIEDKICNQTCAPSPLRMVHNLYSLMKLQRRDKGNYTNTKFVIYTLTKYY